MSQRGAIIASTVITRGEAKCCNHAKMSKEGENVDCVSSFDLELLGELGLVAEARRVALVGTKLNGRHRSNTTSATTEPFLLSCDQPHPGRIALLVLFILLVLANDIAARSAFFMPLGGVSKSCLHGRIVLTQFT